jgi:hypothetical protein
VVEPADCLAIGELAAGEKSALYEFGGSNPPPTTIFIGKRSQSSGFRVQVK